MRALAFSLLATALVAQETQSPQTIKLPAPSLGSISLEKALKERQSVRTLTGPALSIDVLTQLLWSAQGENRPGTGRRTVPSASARYPLELYVIVAKSETLPEGVYKYSTKDHTLIKIKDGGPEAILGPLDRMQPWIPKSPAVFLMAGDSSRFGGNDAMRRETNTYWESGAASQALLLAVAGNGLGATVVGGVNLDAVHAAAGLPAEEKISVIIPVGRIAR
ncbi:MAG: SagB/ThcOx family dehydrogenase [Holophagaceae bacterium]|nr:SagB/ThcOx family dehydrogenase [Holophagaceae bacterium]